MIKKIINWLKPKPKEISLFVEVKDYEPRMQSNADQDLENLLAVIDRIITDKFFEISAKEKRSATIEDVRLLLLNVANDFKNNTKNSELTQLIIDAFEKAAEGNLEHPLRSKT